MTDDTPHPHSRAGLEQRFGPRYRWLVLLTVMLGTMASIMASTIINVAVPDMSRAFALGQGRAQWLSAGFMAAMTLSMLTTPWLLQRFGYRHTYIGVVTLLLSGGVIGGLSSSFELVLAMRVAEGLAAGVLQPIPAIIVMHGFGREEQGKAMGVFGFGVVLAPAIGPSVGGVLVEWFGWRSIFFVVAPFCLVALVLARRYLPITAPGGLAADRRGARLDVVGLLLMAIAVLSLLNGMVQLPGASAATGWTLLACSATALIGFVFHQKRGARPLMELRLFAHRNFGLGSLVAFIYGMALFGSTYLVPVFMQIALGLPPSQAGAALLPAGIVLALTIPVAGRLTDRLPFGRIVAFGLSAAASGKSRSLLHALSQVIQVKKWSPMKLMDDNKAVQGVNMGHLFTELDMLIEQFEALVAMYEAGQIKPHVDRTFRFSEASLAHHYLHDRKAKGKVLLVPD